MTAAVSVTVAASGFRGRRAKYRVAWSVFGDAARIDFRSRRGRELAARGLAGVMYARGADSRGVATREAAYQAARAESRLALGLAAMVRP